MIALKLRRLPSVAAGASYPPLEGEGRPAGPGWGDPTVDASVPGMRSHLRHREATPPRRFASTPRTSKRTCGYLQGRVIRLRLWATAALVCAGLLLAGQGLWIHAKAFLAQILLDRAFDQSVASGTIVKPWPWLDTYPAARIEVPRLGRGAVALEGASGQALAFGPAHVAGTPAAGEGGTAVYAAHRDTHFAFLGEVRTGDEIVVTSRGGVKARYRVTGQEVRRWDDSGIDPTAPGRHLVLATCWPLGAVTSGPLRYLVHAEASER